MQLIKGDCLIESDNIPSGSVDLILTDLPYGTMIRTGDNNESLVKYQDRVKWDTAIEPTLIYDIAKRILRKNGKMVLFSQEPYTNQLISQSTHDIRFNYRAIWEKDKFGVALGATNNMVSYYEDILVYTKHFESENNDDNPCKSYAVKVFNFIDKPMPYINKFYGNSNLSHFHSNGKQFRLCTEQLYQNLIRDFEIDKMDGFIEYPILRGLNDAYKSSFSSTFNLWEGTKYKSNILKYKRDYDGYHPTQKPVLLLEDLIKTFSNEGNLVVDLTMGSGSTGIACINTNRQFIGIEKDDNNFEIAKNRINLHTIQ